MAFMKDILTRNIPIWEECAATPFVQEVQTDMENDLILTARIKKMLEKEFDDQSEEYIEMIADEYFEEHFMEEDE